MFPSFEMLALHCEASAEAAAAPAESAAPESECAPSPISQSIFNQLEIELRGSKRFYDKGLLEEDEHKEEKTATRKRFNDLLGVIDHPAGNRFFGDVSLPFGAQLRISQIHDQRKVALS